MATVHIRVMAGMRVVEDRHVAGMRAVDNRHMAGVATIFVGTEMSRMATVCVGTEMSRMTAIRVRHMARVTAVHHQSDLLHRNEISRIPVFVVFFRSAWPFSSSDPRLNVSSFRLGDC